MSSAVAPSTPPAAPDEVLPTLNKDGTRRWMSPRLFPGRFWRRRQIVAYFLMAVFTALPLIHLNGKPLLLLDLRHREFTFFGTTFYSNETVLLMLLLVSVFVGIFLLTALFGRVWCGWGCPQTVYMEFLFRPIERWLEGQRSERKTPLRRGIKYALFFVASLFLANVFLSYFVGAEELATWVTRSPLEHPGPFFVVAGVTGLMVFDFAYFREQMCTVICPYARLQSVLVDAKSLVIGYDERRGEPRGKLLKVLPNEGAGKTRGDCIDCRACVSACPTGIDIRKGLQLECVACAQCIDACDQIMDRIERPRGLIRYGSTQSLRDGIAGKVLRPRVIVYPLILLLALGTFTVLLSTRPIARVTVLRAVGAPFTETAAGEVANQVRIKVRNQSGEPRAFQLAVESQPGVSLVAPQNPLPVAPGELVTTSVFVTAPRSLFHHGSAKVKLSIRDPDSGFEKQVEHRILGPEKAP